jgi:hypothetical protein
MLVAACYSAGYFRAALRTGWLPSLATVNITAAFVVIGVLLLLFSPVLDPARISVASQVARLVSGKVTAERFDFAFLRFDGERYGRAALNRLEQTAAGPDAALVRRQIAAVRKMESPWDRDRLTARPADLAVNLILHQPGMQLPASFLRTDWTQADDFRSYPECLRLPDKRCDAYLLDVNGDGKPEILVSSRVEPVAAQPAIAVYSQPQIVVLAEDADGQWSQLATVVLPKADCRALHDKLSTGKVATVRADLADIDIGGVRGRLQPASPSYGCLPKAAAGK